MLYSIQPVRLHEAAAAFLSFTMVSILARMFTCCSICFVKLLRLLVSSMNTDIRINVMDTATDARKMSVEMPDDIFICHF